MMMMILPQALRVRFFLQWSIEMEPPFKKRIKIGMDPPFNTKRINPWNGA
jgi:hypothetical protein